MIRIGAAPYIECSSAGYKRFSAFHACVRRYGCQSIEALYQARKVFADGRTGLTWQEAKGRAPVNMDECRRWYVHLWAQYIVENPDLIPILLAASGLQDRFGQAGHCCQATALWEVRSALLADARHRSIADHPVLRDNLL